MDSVRRVIGLLDNARSVLCEASTTEAPKELQASGPGPSRSESRPPTRTPAEEHHSLFSFRPSRATLMPASSRKRSKMSRFGRKQKIWSREFVCLSRRNDISAPSTTMLTRLRNAGLGWKQLEFPVGGGAREVHNVIVTALPALNTGYEILRIEGGGSKQLSVLEQPVHGYNVDFLKATLNQAKGYLRPIQSDLSLERADEVDDT